MDLREEILAEHSRKQLLKISGWIGGDEKRFKELLELFLQGEYRVVQRSSGVVSYVSEKHPGLIEKNLPLLVNRLDDDNIHVAVKRNVIRVLQFIPIPKSIHAKVMNKCFEYLSDPNEAIAVRCFSMTVLLNLAKKYPDIKRETEDTIKLAAKNAKGGLKVRARDTLKELGKI
jgi:hypothetical protein